MSEGSRKPPVARMVAKCKESGERYEIGCMWENQFSGSGNFDWSFYREDEDRPEGQMNRMSLQTFAERGGAKNYFVNHWTVKRREAEDAPF